MISALVLTAEPEDVLPLPVLAMAFCAALRAALAEAVDPPAPEPALPLAAKPPTVARALPEAATVPAGALLVWVPLALPPEVLTYTCRRISGLCQKRVLIEGLVNRGYRTRSSAPSMREIHGEAVKPQVFRDHLRQLGVVVHHQNSAHRLASCPHRIWISVECCRQVASGACKAPAKSTQPAAARDYQLRPAIHGRVTCLSAIQPRL